MDAGRAVRMGAVAVAAGLVVGCQDGSDPAVPDNELSDREVEELVGALVEAGGIDLDLQAENERVVQPAAAGGPAPFYAAVYETVSCPAGGTVDVQGMMEGERDLVTGAGSAESLLRLQHSACRAAAASGGMFELNGAPTLHTQFRVERREAGEVTFHGMQLGTVEWARDGRTGTCGVDVDLSLRPDGSLAMTGMVCGRYVENSSI